MSALGLLSTKVTVPPFLMVTGEGEKPLEEYVTVALIGVGESDTENRAVEAVEKAINNPLLDVDISGASGALINISGGPDMTLDEARKIVEIVSEKLDEDARIIWGAQISEDLKNTVRALLIITGVKSTQIFGTERQASVSTRKKKEIETELGIEFID